MDRLPHTRDVVKSKGMDHIAIFQLLVAPWCDIGERKDVLVVSSHAHRIYVVFLLQS